MNNYFFQSIKCHTFSEPQARSDLNDDEDDDDDDDVDVDDDDDDHDINEDNKEEEEEDDEKLFFQKYQVSYLFGTTSSV